MSKALKWLEAEADRLEKEYIENDDPNKTVNHSFIEGFNYALVNLQAIEELELNDNQKIVLEWAKEYLTETKNIAWFIEELAFLPTTGGKLRYREVAHSYESLNNKEKLDLLNIITLWAVEQEEAE
ncbi:hypothetical protein ACJZQ5_002924 [Enterococcus hirae]|uniref:Uncharacterized protein n=2 Tax=Enterococcus hirae TaxID=1354 RepID=I6RXU0_ENTHA|nr:hypothetical protein [Enterococcus hirae]AFM69135.1 hypothetical protein EHR_00705 [Enterococcus hirae ATCC 9790]EMF0221649.1 hypothetical protein [Enterococcus hirae]EMF0235281.1 hypothetical protein [Enterococcus hirae]EMF0456099.1 hypothetical protein [Enterococcus hirae]EOH69130.1 hypothetical protein UAE_02269 [Enterococcus hirae ATCC 9790]